MVSYEKRLVSFMTYTRGEEGEGEEEVVSYEKRLVSFMNLIVDKSMFLFSR